MYPVFSIHRYFMCFTLMFFSLFWHACVSAAYDRDRSQEPLLGEVIPNFTAETTQEKNMVFHEWLDRTSGYVVFFSHPKDFTPVCTTELASIIPLQEEMKQKGVTVRFIGLSVDSVAQHQSWIKDIEAYTRDVMKYSGKVTYPIIGDPSLRVAKRFGMLPYNAGNSSEGRSAEDNMTVRSLFIIGPDKKVRLKLVQPMSVGRNFDEVKRLLLALSVSDRNNGNLATPANWQPRNDLIINPTLPDKTARQYSGYRLINLPSNKTYLRTAKDTNY